MKKFIKFLLWCVVIVLAVFALWKVYHFVKYTPWKKSHPEHYLTLKGNIDPKIAKDFKFYMDYATSKRSCDRVNYIAGVRGVRVKTFPVNLNPDKSGNYEIKIPLDKFHKGFCGWGAYGFDFKFKRIMFDMVLFSKDVKKTIPEQIKLGCGMDSHNEEICYLNLQEAEIGPLYNYDSCSDCNMKVHMNIKSRK